MLPVVAAVVAMGMLAMVVVALMALLATSWPLLVAASAAIVTLSAAPR